MTRKEKALLANDNREINGEIQTQYSNGIWDYCCPAFIDCGEDDLDEQTSIRNGNKVRGCRGINCVECWGKEA